jgi:hypothetical protein
MNSDSYLNILTCGKKPTNSFLLKKVTPETMIKVSLAHTVELYKVFEREALTLLKDAEGEKCEMKRSNDHV